MPSLANCPTCQASVQIHSIQTPSLQLRCPFCTGMFHVSDVLRSCTEAPPFAQPVEEPTAHEPPRDDADQRWGDEATSDVIARYAAQYEPPPQEQTGLNAPADEQMQPAEVIGSELAIDAPAVSTPVLSTQPAEREPAPTKAPTEGIAAESPSLPPPSESIAEQMALLASAAEQSPSELPTIEPPSTWDPAAMMESAVAPTPATTEIEPLAVTDTSDDDLPSEASAWLAEGAAAPIESHLDDAMLETDIEIVPDEPPAAETAPEPDHYAVAGADETGEAAIGEIVDDQVADPGIRFAGIDTAASEASPWAPAQATSFAVRQRARARNEVGLVGVIAGLVGLVLSGVLGLSLGYLILVWWFGAQQGDFLQLRDKYPTAFRYLPGSDR